jgi:hypothetical protein
MLCVIVFDGKVIAVGMGGLVRFHLTRLYFAKYCLLCCPFGCLFYVTNSEPYGLEKAIRY